MRLKILGFVFCLIFMTAAAEAAQGTESQKPPDFVDTKKIIPSLALDIRYYTPHNFLGVRVDGYEAPKCLLTKKAALALAQVQKELSAFNLSLKIYDCYRPQRAVNHFIRWAEDINDVKTKKEFYPQVDKKNLFRDGFVAQRSGHSRGSTVDLTIVPLPLPAQPRYTPGQKLCECYKPVGQRFADNSLDMGTGFDCFSELSHTLNPRVGPSQRAHRMLLHTLMQKHGFAGYDKEWWHYTLKNEPYPDTYFDFLVK